MAQTIKLKRSGTQGAEPSTSDLALGEVAINTYDGKMFIKKNDGSDSIVELGTGGGSAAIYIKTTVTATAGQTTVTGLTYTAGLVDVYLNGARLVVGQDVTATNGTSVVLASGANLNDIIQVVAFKASEAFTPASPTFTGTLTAPIINASTTLQVGGIAVTSTASELNLLDGATTTAAELNILDNATITTAELNLLDGVTATTAELNILDGVTSTATELNILDGVTATAAELNYVDGVTSNIQTQLDAAPSPTITATASGAIANGNKVCINANGTVSAITGTYATEGLGSLSTFNSTGATYSTVSCYDTGSNKMVVFYITTGDNKGYCVVGTYNSSTNVYDWGTPVEFREGETGTQAISCAYDPDTDRVVVVYKGGATADWAGTLDHCYSKVGAYNSSTNKYDFGSYQEIKGSVINSPWVVYDEHVDRMVVGYNLNTSPYTAYVKVCTVNGSAKSLTLGAEQTVHSSSTNWQRNSVHYDPDAERIIIMFQDYSASEAGACLVGTVIGASTNTMSVGAKVTFDNGNISNSMNKFMTAYDTTANKSIVFYQRQTENYQGKYCVGTINANGTQMDFGDAALLAEHNQTNHMSMVYNTTANKLIFFYYSTAQQHVYVNSGTLSGTVITKGTEQRLLSINGPAIWEYNFGLYDPDAGKIMVIYNDQDDSPSGRGKSFAWTTGFFNSNVTSENYIGVADGAYADGAAATIQIIGAVDDAQSSLTPGQDYYVQADGTLGLTAGATSVRAGLAIAATKLIVKG